MGYVKSVQVHQNLDEVKKIKNEDTQCLFGTFVAHHVLKLHSFTQKIFISLFTFVDSLAQMLLLQQ